MLRLALFCCRVSAIWSALFLQLTKNKISVAANKIIFAQKILAVITGISPKNGKKKNKPSHFSIIADILAVTLPSASVVPSASLSSRQVSLPLMLCSAALVRLKLPCHRTQWLRRLRMIVGKLGDGRSNSLTSSAKEGDKG